MVKVFAIWACIVSIPAVAHAQAAIAGTVRDSFGSAVPGVSIEATSDALIERTRTAIADDAGRYRIEDLRPGIYQVRFTLQGWKSYQREGIELKGTFTAMVDAELSIGGVTETVTVAGESPAVDIQSVRHEITLTSDIIRSIPTVRSYNALVVLVPGVVTNVNDTVTGTATTSFPMYGGRTNEGRLALDGMTIGSAPAGNSAASYVVDAGTADEITFTTPGTAGEVETAGLVLNIVPRSGGNTKHGSFFASGTGEKLQGDNLTMTLKKQGVMAATPLTKVYDVSGTFGGAIARDRVWYFVNAHIGGNTKDSPNVYYNLNAGDATQWLYVPDKSRRAYSDRTFENASGRVTVQLTPRNKITGLWDAQALCRTCTGATPGLSEPQQISPEAVGVLGRPLHVTQATWQSPVTNNWLLESGYSGTYFGVGNFEREPNPTRGLIRVVEQCASGCAANGDIPGLTYRSQDFSIAYAGSYLWKGTASYITGTKSVKFGYQHTLMTDDRTWFTNDQNLTYRFNNGIPNQLTESISPWVNNARAAWDGLFIQAQRTHDRLTLQSALRFDRAVSWFPEQHEGPSRFLPDAIIIPPTRGVNSYKDLSPRVGLVYDVTGKATTAIKAHVGRYLEGAGTMSTYANSNPSSRMPQTTMQFGTAGVTRSWIDNGNLIPDCDLLNPAAQDSRASGGDACGVLSNTNFGKNILTNEVAPDVLSGWGVRPSDWTFAVTLQQQVGTRSSLDVTYTRRWYRGFFVLDNQALQPSDLTPYSIVAPSDPRLPSGGGYEVSGLYDVVPEKSGQVSNLVTSSDSYGTWSQSFNGIDVTMNVRVGNNLVLVGGTSTGQTVADNCDVRDHLPELATNGIGATGFGPGLVGSVVGPVSPYCHVAYGILTQVRGLSSYVVPRVGVNVSATFQSKPGPLLAANYAASSAEVSQSLGRAPSGNVPNVTINLVKPGTMYGARVNQLDWRVGKEIRHGRTRTLLALDIYNALNSSTVLTYDSTFVPGGPWLRPTSILTPRFLKITAELQF